MKRLGLLVATCSMVFAACRPSLPPPPELEGLSPASAHMGEQITVTLSGKNLRARIQTRLEDPKHSSAELPKVVFVRGDQRVDAKVLELVSPEALTIRTPELPLAATWDVELTDAWGRSATLEQAFDAIECATAADCDDGIECTAEACTDGNCVYMIQRGACLIDSECVAEGDSPENDPCLVCNPEASETAYSAAEDGTECDDHDACTTDDACSSGICMGNAKHCEAGTCETATCDPETGSCGTVEADDGTLCDDELACTGGDQCQSGKCSGEWRCGNTPPRACLSLTPVGALTSITSPVSFDASCSTDLESMSELQFRFDFDGDGTWDTSFSSSPTAQHAYATPGTFAVAVEVRDSGGLSGYASAFVSADTGTDDVMVRVTTGADENDADATPSNPGSSGLSLREAIQYANQNSSVRRILFNPGLTVTCAKPLPVVQNDDLTIVGEPDVQVDFTGTTDTSIPCLQLNGKGQKLVSLNARGCPGQLVDLLSSDQQVLGGRFEGSGSNSESAGIRFKSSAQSVGPGTELLGFGIAIELKSSDAVVDGVRIHDCNLGVHIMNNGPNARIDRSVLYANHVGIDSHFATTTVRACTLDHNSEDAIFALGSGTLAVRSSLLTHNGGYGIHASVGTIVTRDTNGYFDNGSGDLANGQTPAVHDVTADPEYLDPRTGDFRLAPASPAVDAGVDLGLNLIGAGPQRFNGPNPDLGAEESPW